MKSAAATQTSADQAARSLPVCAKGGHRQESRRRCRGEGLDFDAQAALTAANTAKVEADKVVVGKTEAAKAAETSNTTAVAALEKAKAEKEAG